MTQKMIFFEYIIKHYPRLVSSAFCDGINDKEMLELVGNGIDELKTIADEITESVVDDGTKNILVRIFFACNFYFFMVRYLK